MYGSSWYDERWEYGYGRGRRRYEPRLSYHPPLPDVSQWPELIGRIVVPKRCRAGVHGEQYKACVCDLEGTEVRIIDFDRTPGRVTPTYVLDGGHIIQESEFSTDRPSWRSW